MRKADRPKNNVHPSKTDLVQYDEIEYIDVSEDLKLNPRQMKYFIQYVRTGNAAQSYMETYGVDKASAVIASTRLNKKFPQIRRALFEANGLTEKAMLKTVKDALKAKIEKRNKKGEVSYLPDHNTRLRAVEIREKMLKDDEEQDNRTKGTGINIQVNIDREKEVFEIK